ncbi:phage virion morphogenesis protein [Chromohalobacter canadensis]|uniref:phage virion morphogenesis protein n=1 Tax=Chromohalobacter canadensis TaxID=141389 RepID=UPI0021BDF9C8|nr:phage virion morphogenesis protein [Chromohalobacter canadensis]MCT8469457.1 phage virion morphogenesis protein [Chromohalobacter canadensis]MCT8472081.1 phage virion morphogenesis protein [Chromohalobacter canadensis]MCT8499806.1 phage virion morphogenesis protein [Chromohalobacter canadensis]
MTDDLQALEDWAAPLLAQLEAKERRRLARAIARDLRRSQRQRIRSQTNPDGTPYAPRQPQKWRSRQGSIRRSAMFDKLSTAKWMKATAHGDTAVVSFMGNVARIARTHQYGLRDRVDRDGPTIEYPQRELLGFTDADRELVINALFTHLDPV